MSTMFVVWKVKVMQHPGPHLNWSSLQESVKDHATEILEQSTANIILLAEIIGRSDFDNSLTELLLKLSFNAKANETWLIYICNVYITSLGLPCDSINLTYKASEL